MYIHMKNEIYEMHIWRVAFSPLGLFKLLRRYADYDLRKIQMFLRAFQLPNFPC